MMKKIFSIVVVVMTLAVASVAAQTRTVEGKVSFGQRFSNAATKVKEEAVKVGTRVGDAFEEVTAKSDLIKIKGIYYMPLYSVNLYRGADANAFRAECQREFQARYPRAVITSAVCPQTDWVVTRVKERGQVVGFLQTMYCYVIAVDTEGSYFMNAKFAFKRYKEIGADAHEVAECWPEWERTDVMTKETYARLLTK